MPPRGLCGKNPSSLFSAGRSTAFCFFLSFSFICFSFLSFPFLCLLFAMGLILTFVGLLGPVLLGDVIDAK